MRGLYVMSMSQGVHKGVALTIVSAKAECAGSHLFIELVQGRPILEYEAAQRVGGYLPERSACQRRAAHKKCCTSRNQGCCGNREG